MKLKNILGVFLILATFKKELQARLSAATEGMKNLEQDEITQPIKAVLWECDWAQKRLKEMAEVEALADEAQAALAEHDQQVGEAALAAAIADKKVINIEDHNTLLASAKEAGKQEAETAFRAEREQDKTVTERRVALVAKVGEVAANSLTREDFLAEDYEARVAKVEERVTKLAEVGITAETRAKNFASLMACKSDEDGEKEFASRLELLTEAGIKASGPTDPGGRMPVIPVGKTEVTNKYGTAKGI